MPKLKDDFSRFLYGAAVYLANCARAGLWIYAAAPFGPDHEFLAILRADETSPRRQQG